MVKDFNKNYTFNEAKETVLEALSVLGEDYLNNLKKAFDERWIDIYNNKGKRNGAYSSGFYDTKPYLLLNYEGRYEDVTTLIHELGHFLSAKLLKVEVNKIYLYPLGGISKFFLHFIEYIVSKRSDAFSIFFSLLSTIPCTIAPSLYNFNISK